MREKMGEVWRRRDGDELGVAMAMELSYQGGRGAWTARYMTHLTWSLSTASEAGAALGPNGLGCTRSRIRPQPDVSYQAAEE
jgi:hypothetical protein